MMRHQIARVCAAMAVMAVLAAGQAHGADRTVRVGVYQNEPKIFLDKKGQPAGLFIELLGDIAAQQGWTLTYVPCEWATCLRALEEHEIDLMPDVAYTSERDERFDFHKIPVLESWSRLYAAADAPIRKISDLDGKRIAVLQGSIQESVFEQLMRGFGYKVTLVTAASFKQAFELTQDGAADAAITNHLFGDYFYQEYGLSKSAIDINPIELYYTTARGRNADLLAGIDRYLQKWISEPDSPYYTTLGHWTEKTENRLPKYFGWVAGAIAGLLILALGVILLLRSQVRARTEHLEQAAEAIRTLNAELEQRVVERTRELDTANKNLESFSYSVSHDLRAPLRAVSGFADIIARRHHESLNDEGRHYVDNIVQASKRMGHLIDDLLTFSRLGRKSVQRAPVSLAKVLDDIASDMQGYLGPLQGSIDIAEGLPVVQGDATLLRQIFTNLLENAVTYRAPDKPPRIQITHETDGGLIIKVSDNGIGIRPEYFEKIFDIFQRLHTDEEYPGTGIGLATVKKSIDMLGGEVWVESKFGEGSTFFVKLPYDAGAAAAPVGEPNG